MWVKLLSIFHENSVGNHKKINYIGQETKKIKNYCCFRKNNLLKWIIPSLTLYFHLVITFCFIIVIFLYPKCFFYSTISEPELWISTWTPCPLFLYFLSLQHTIKNIIYTLRSLSFHLLAKVSGRIILKTAYCSLENSSFIMLVVLSIKMVILIYICSFGPNSVLDHYLFFKKKGYTVLSELWKLVPNRNSFSHNF